jgi:hypothetical protein
VSAVLTRAGAPARTRFRTAVRADRGTMLELLPVSRWNYAATGNGPPMAGTDGAKPFGDAKFSSAPFIGLK